MKKYYFILTFLSLAIYFNLPRNSDQEKDEYAVTEVVVPVGSCEEAEFSKSLDTGDYGIDIMQLSHPTAKELVIHTNDHERLLCEIRRTLPGIIQNAVTADLNADGNPELYVFSQERSDSTAVMAFELINDQYTEIAVPKHSLTGSYSYELIGGRLIETIRQVNGQTEVHELSLSTAGILEKIG